MLLLLLLSASPAAAPAAQYAQQQRNRSRSGAWATTSHEVLARLYARDAELHRRAKIQPGLCHTPERFAQ